jgi:hypothetical protein
MFIYNYFTIYFLYRKNKKRYSKLFNKLNTLIEKNTNEILLKHIRQELFEISKQNDRLKDLLNTCNEVIINCTFKYLVIVLVPIIFITIRTLFC